MGIRIEVTTKAVVNGQALSQVKNVDGSTSVLMDHDVPAAKAGTLATRTDDNTGTFTMVTGHGLTTGAIVDVFWADGARLGMEATVTGDSIVLDGGSGDVLPAQTTICGMMVPVEKVLNIVGNSALVLACSTTKRGVVKFAESGGTVHLTRVMGLAGAWNWYDGNGDANPIAGDTIAKVFLSHGFTGGTNNMRASGLV
jgi:hypothetical protein